MSFYRNILAVVAAIAIASPVFADDTAVASSESAATAPTETAAPAAATDTAAPAAATDTAAAATEAKVNLNKATAKELMKVKGVKGSQARAIVAYRKAHGDFKAVEDLSKVKGFTKMKADALKAIEDQLTVG